MASVRVESHFRTTLLFVAPPSRDVALHALAGLRSPLLRAASCNLRFTALSAQGQPTAYSSSFWAPRHSNSETTLRKSKIFHHRARPPTEKSHGDHLRVWTSMPGWIFRLQVNLPLNCRGGEFLLLSFAAFLLSSRQISCMPCKQWF